MVRNLVTLTMGLMLCGLACADDEPVLRVQSIKPVEGASKATLKQKRPTEASPFAVSVNSKGFEKDHFITDASTIAALEFLIGGRVAINKDTDIEIVNERSVADGKTSVKRVILKNGSLWVKADAKSLKQPLEIQTNGGVMGIKGTEFTVESRPDNTTKVCCFESNSTQGGVEVRDKSGKVVSVVKPGDELVTSVKGAEIVKTSEKHYENTEEFRNSVLSSPEWNQAYQAYGVATQIMGAMGVYVPWQVGGAFSAAYAVTNFEQHPVASLQALSSAVGHPVYVPGPFGGMIDSAASQPPKPDFPTNLAPDAEGTVKTSNSFPQFSWKGVEDADGYVVMLSPNDKFEETLLVERVKGESVAYSKDMRPLKPGQYYWRVIPVDGEDKPVQRGSQASFTVTP